MGIVVSKSHRKQLPTGAFEDERVEGSRIRSAIISDDISDDRAKCCRQESSTRMWIRHRDCG